MTEEEESKLYKPLSLRSKFKKPNQQGQIASNCIKFNFCGKHCWPKGDYKTNATDCKVLKGKFCEKYICCEKTR